MNVFKNKLTYGLNSQINIAFFNFQSGCNTGKQKLFLRLNIFNLKQGKKIVSFLNQKMSTSYR